MERVRVFNQGFIDAPAELVWGYITDWAGTTRPRRSTGMGPLALSKIELEGDPARTPRTRVMHFDSLGIIRETLLYQNDEAMHLYYNIEGEGPAGVRNYLATTEVDAVSPTRCQVTITARFDLARGADVAKAKAVIDFAHNMAVIGGARAYFGAASQG